MKIEYTLSILKPDVVSKNLIGQIYTRFENVGLEIIAAKMYLLSKKEAEKFYDAHKERLFFKDLVNFMISGPIMIQVLACEDAIAKNRNVMGFTDPKKAEKQTIRAIFGENIERNAVHGSDSHESAISEIAFFFSNIEIFKK